MKCPDIKIGEKSHFENDLESIKEVIVTPRFKKDAPDFDVKDVFGCEHLHATRLHKFEKHVGNLHIFRAIENEIHHIYAVDKDHRLIFLRAFKNFKKYGKFLSDNKAILKEVESV